MFEEFSNNNLAFVFIVLLVALIKLKNFNIAGAAKDETDFTTLLSTERL